MYLGKKYKERTATGWSDSKSPGEFLKDQAHGISVSSKGTYYFAVYKKEDEGKIGALHYSRFIDGKYESPVKLSTEINTGNDIAHPYIAPDESYLIWDTLMGVHFIHAALSSERLTTTLPPFGFGGTKFTFCILMRG